VKVYIDFEPGDYRATFIGFARDDTDINASCADGGGHFSPFFGSAITFNIGGGIVPGPGPGPGPGGDIFVRVTRINQCGSRTEDVCVLEAVVESSSTDTKYVLFRDGDGNLIGKGTNIEGAENGVSTLVLDQCLKGEEDGDPITYNITAIPYIVF